jgi:hypothetical protein
MARYASGSELILKEGVTTSNGNAGGTTVIDASLIGKPDFPSGLQIRLLSGTYQLITRTIESFNTVTGTMTVPSSTPFPGQIVLGTGYVIMGVTATSADVLTLVDDIHISAAEELKDFIAKTGGTEVPAGTSLYGELAGAGFVTATDSLAAAADDLDQILEDTHISAAEELKDFIAKTGGTEIGAAKSLTDALGHTGLARLDSGLDGVLADGLINGTGTVLPANKSMIDHLGGAGFVTGTDSLRVIAADIAQILDMTRSEGLVAVTAAETSLFIDDTPTIIINGLSIKIDLTNIAAGDTYVLREYYRITNGGAYFKISDDAANTYVGVQTSVLKVVSLEAYRYGCKVTAQKTVGVDRSFQVETLVEA